MPLSGSVYSRGYASQLGLGYVFYPLSRRILFEDGVEYTVEEFLELSHVSETDVDLRAIHRVKAAFEGDLLPLE